MRKSAIPLMFFVVMCSLNILLAGCGANVPASKTTTTAARVASPVAEASSCNSCQAHQLVAMNLASVGFQTANEPYPATTNLIDAKIADALEARGLNTSMYSRDGKTLTFTYTDGKKLTVKIDDFARVKEVKQLAADNSVVQHFSHGYGSYSAPLTVNNLRAGSPAILAVANYNSSQQLFRVTDNVNSQTHAISPPVSPYPSVFNNVPPPLESNLPSDEIQVGPPSAAVQACWNGCTNAYEQAKANAYSDLAITTATALAVYLAALLVCLASAAFYPICAAGFFAAYAAAIATATASWLATLNAAAEDYNACLDACCVANGLPAGSWSSHVPVLYTLMDPWNIPSSDDLN